MVSRLVTLCDRAPATPYKTVQLVLEKELVQSVSELFERFDLDPLGSASIAQVVSDLAKCSDTVKLRSGDVDSEMSRENEVVTSFIHGTSCHYVHRARLGGHKGDVLVKVQHSGVQDLMMTDIRNLQAFALYMQKTDIKFDLFSVTKEMEKQIGYEFDFAREADAMERIRHFLYKNNRKYLVLVPRLLPDMVTRKVVVMEYIDGIPILNLGDEVAKRGINPGGKGAAAAKQ